MGQRTSQGMLHRWVLVCAAVALGCGGDATYSLRRAEAPVPPERASRLPVPPGSIAAPTAVMDPDARPALTTVDRPDLVFQPGFHQALRWSYSTPGKVTLRYKVPVSRAGARIRITVAAGDGSLVLHRATVAKAGSAGELASSAMALTFASARGATLQAREQVVSDPLPFPVRFMDELYVSLVVEGALAASAIDAFPESFEAWGDQAFSNRLHDHAERKKLTGLTTIHVEARAGLAIVAIGDSITEGYVSGQDDVRRSWPHVLALETGIPVANGAVSGQGLWAAREYFDRENGTLRGATDCVVLLGTNDLGGSKTAPELAERLEQLFSRLRGMCRIWAGTLLPKEKTSTGDLVTVNQVRAELNEWIRTEANVDGVIDFERAVANPEDPNRFILGYGYDGIHPSVAGQSALGQYAAQFVGNTLGAQQ